MGRILARALDQQNESDGPELDTVVIHSARAGAEHNENVLHEPQIAPLATSSGSSGLQSIGADLIRHLEKFLSLRDQAHLKQVAAQIHRILEGQSVLQKLQALAPSHHNALTANIRTQHALDRIGGRSSDAAEHWVALAALSFLLGGGLLFMRISRDLIHEVAYGQDPEHHMGGLAVAVFLPFSLMETSFLLGCAFLLTRQWVHVLRHDSNRRPFLQENARTTEQLNRMRPRYEAALRAIVDEDSRRTVVADASTPAVGHAPGAPDEHSASSSTPNEQTTPPGP